MTNGRTFTLRVALPNDADGVTSVLASAYPGLMAADYDPAVLALSLPAMTRANPALLASGTYYLQEAAGARIVSCGGWTREEPGTNTLEDEVAHIRHFGTHADWVRQGLGRGIFEHCRREALAAGIQVFKCFSSLGAEAFYASLGFQTTERTHVTLRGGLILPSVTMVRTTLSQPERRQV